MKRRGKEKDGEAGGQGGWKVEKVTKMEGEKGLRRGAKALKEVKR